IGGVFGAPVVLGILASANLAKVVETLKLERGDAGLLTVDREIVSRLEPSFAVELFKFSADVAQYLFGSTDPVAVVADPVAAVTDDPVTLLSGTPFDFFMGLSRAPINEASVAVEFAQVVSEAVGTGNGVLGGVQGEFSLDRKIKAIADVTVFLVGGVNETANLVAGSTPAAGQIAIELGEQDSPTTGSGAITFGASKIPANGAAIVATYKPSFTTGAGDIVNLTDFVFDPTLGRIRFRHAGADASPFRLAANAGGTALLVDYTYVRKASNTLKPFTRNQVDGRAVVRHLPDVGVNFIWTIPSTTIRVTDDDLTFGAEDFATGALALQVNDAGGTDRFGTLDLSSEVEANA
ncbi:MAG: hypothetical protein ACRDTJ_09115, partial [Pseudonocardiaceae bacterium]